MLSDDLFFAKMPEILQVDCFQLNRNTSPCIFLAGLLFVFEK